MCLDVFPERPERQSAGVAQVREFHRPALVRDAHQPQRAAAGHQLTTTHLAHRRVAQHHEQNRLACDPPGDRFLSRCARLALHPLPAWARPGTPNKEEAHPCGPRAICVQFNNTATEKVMIEAGTQRPGHKFQSLRRRPNASIERARTPNFIVTRWVDRSNAGPAMPVFSGGNILGQGRRYERTCQPHAYKFSNLKPGVRYCFPVSGTALSPTRWFPNNGPPGPARFRKATLRLPDRRLSSKSKSIPKSIIV